MRKYFLLTCCLHFFYSSSSQSVFDSSVFDSIVVAEQRDEVLKLSATQSSFTDEYDVTYMRAQWQVDPRVYYISGNITFYIKPIATGLSDVYFDLNDTMLVNSFTFHSVTSTNFSRDNNQVILHLQSAIPTGTLDSVTISYEGKPVSTGFGSFTQSSHINDSTNVTENIIYTLSEPYGASDWFPCKNSLTDKMDSIDIIVQMPEQYKVGTNGVVVENFLLNDSTRLMHWRSRYPIVTYLVGIAVTNYSEFDEDCVLSSGDTVKVIEYVYPEDSLYYSTHPGTVVPMIQLYSNLFGDYPFKKEKYGHAQWNWGGGEEHQTMSFVNFPDEFELVAHELGHQWFGDKITCGSWQDIWLNEGFATYLAGLTYENLGPVYWLPYKSGTLTRALRDSVNSVFCDDTTSVSRIFSSQITYAKGMYVLHMLRWKLGDSIFFKAIYNYINDTDLCYGFARTENLKQHLEETSGENLDEFFNDWFYGKGYPSYHINWSVFANGFVALAIHQTQNNPDVSFFEMPLPIELKDATHDTIVRVENNFNDENFQLGPFSFTPDTLKFDPDLWIASTHNTITHDPSLTTPSFIYPNPASNEIQIYHGTTHVNEIAIYDLSGKILFDINLTVGGFNNPITLDVSNYVAGMYVIEMKSDQLFRAQKFIKQ